MVFVVVISILSASAGIAYYNYTKHAAALEEQYLIDHNVTLTVNEMGLPSGSNWSISVTSNLINSKNPYQQFGNYSVSSQNKVTGLTLGRQYVIYAMSSRYHLGYVTTHLSYESTLKTINNLTPIEYLTFYPNVTASFSFNVLLNNRTYWFINDYGDGETNVSSYSVSLAYFPKNYTGSGTPTTLSPPGQNLNQSAWVYLKGLYTVDSIILTSNVSGFSLNHSDPMLPVNATYNLPYDLYININLTVPDYPISTHLAFTLVITWNQ